MQKKAAAHPDGGANLQCYVPGLKIIYDQIYDCACIAQVNPWYI
jgi:hypothetical protein